MKLKLFLCSLFIFGFQLNAMASDKLNVVASIQTLADLAETVGGDKVSVMSLSKGYMDPHFVEAKPSLVVTIHRADMIIFVGLELEKGWLPPLMINARNDKIQPGTDGYLDASTTVPGIKRPKGPVDRSQGDIHPLGNPHFWIPPYNALSIARGIRDHLKKLMPESASTFDSNYNKFASDVTEAERGLELKIKKLAGLKVVPYHDSWAYVSDWLKLQETGFIEPKPGIPPDPQHLVSLINIMKNEKTKAILMENFYNRDIARNVAEKSGATLLAMPSDVGATPEIKSYIDLMKAVVDKLQEAH